MCVVVVALVGASLAVPARAASFAGARAEATTLGRAGTATLGAGSVDGDIACPGAPDLGNLLSPEVSGMDSVAGWSDGGNARLAQSIEQAAEGDVSLELAALAGGAMTAQTAPGEDGVAALPGYTYIASAEFLANHKLRPANVAIVWYGIDGAELSASPGDGVLEVTGKWAVASHSSVAPKGAAYAALAVTVADAFRGEKHYVDAASIEASQEDAPPCEPEDVPDDDNENNGNGDNGNGDNGNGDNGNGDDNDGADGNGAEPSGGGHGSGASSPGNDQPSGASGPPENRDDRGRGAPPLPAGLDAWQPVGPYSTASLMTAALRLKALGWSEEAISRKVFAPFIIGGEAGWTDTWGAPRSEGRSHEGQDVFCNYGDPVLATEDGTVEFDEGGLGGRVARLHRPDGSYWYYAHLSDWNTDKLSSGDAVATGDVIGYCGNTGNAISTPPHVHFGLYTANGAAVNPMGKLVGWLQVAQERTLGYVEKITDRRVLEIDRLTSARRFGDGFIPVPSDESGPPTDIILASRSLRMFSTLQAALSQSGADLEATDSAGDLVDPELLHFRLWLTSNELSLLWTTLPVAPN